MYLDLGLLFMRLAVGGMMCFGHGWGKMMGFSEIAPRFPNLFGLSGTINLGLAVFAEVFCAIAVMIGLKTRLSSIPLIITMLVAAFMVHAADPWAKKEFALLYAVPFLTLVFTGGGRFSLDTFFEGRSKQI